MSLMYRRVPLGHIMSFWTACLNLNQVSPCDKTPSKWPCIYIVPEISALCFRGICSCSLPPASVQWRCSCWAVSAWCSPCSAGSWCLLGVHTTLSLHISLSKPWTATFWDVHPAHTTIVVPQQHDQCNSEHPRATHATTNKRNNQTNTAVEVAIKCNYVHPGRKGLCKSIQTFMLQHNGTCK